MINDKQEIDMLLTSMDRVRVTRIACSNKHSLVCTNTGAVFSWGQNDYGQLGHANGPNLGKRGEQEPGLYCATPKKVFSIDNKHFVTDVACGDNHSIALQANRDALVWGSNLEGQLGIDPSATTWASTPRKLVLYEYMNSSNREGFTSILAREKYSVFVAESRYIYVSHAN